ncbi:TonB-dependent receptor [bacterium]|nr:TonB-dependent receptor [bacterium]
MQVLIVSIKNTGQADTFLPRLYRSSLFIFLTLLLIASPFLSQPLLAQTDKLLKTDDLLNLPFTALMNIKIITATKHPQKIADTPASIVIITRKQIQTFGYENLGEILRSIPGLYFIDDYNYPYNYGIRGFWTDTPNKHMTIMINGVKRPSNYTNDNDLRYLMIPPEAIERIEVIRGPNSLIHGSGAFFGVINIITTSKQAIDKSQIHLSYGTQNTRKIIATSTKNGTDWSLSAFASLHIADGLNLHYSDFGSENNTSIKNHTDTYYMNAGITSSWGPLTIHAYFSECKNDNVFLFPAVDAGSTSSLPMTVLSVLYKKQWHPDWLIRSQFTFTRRSEIYDYSILYSDFYGLQHISSSGWFGSAEALYSPNENLEIIFGFDGENIDKIFNNYDLPGFQTHTLTHIKNSIHPDDNLQVRAGYLRISTNLSSHLQFTGGLRLEQQCPYRILFRNASLGDLSYMLEKSTASIDNSQWKLVPQTAMIYKPTPSLALKLLYGKAIQHPSLFQSFGQDRTEGAESLKPEWVETFEIALGFESSNNLSINASVFYNILDDLILRSTGFYPSDHPDTPNEYFNFFDNIGKQRAYGFELQLACRLSSGFSIDLAATRQSLINQYKTAIPIGYNPPWLLYGKASWHINKYFQIGITGQFIDKMKAAWDLATSSRIGDNSPTNTLLGLNLRFAPPKLPKFYGQLHIFNLLNNKIIYPTTTNSTWAPRGTRDRGRSITITIGYQL